MKAIVQDRFGLPDVLELREIDRPEAGDDQVLVRVKAASVNPADWYAMVGAPYLARPQMGLRRPRSRLGIDLAGVVEAVGGRVTRLRVGDEVFGRRLSIAFLRPLTAEEAECDERYNNRHDRAA